LGTPAHNGHRDSDCASRHLLNPSHVL